MTRSATTILLAVCLTLPLFGQIKSLNHALVPAPDGDFIFVVAGDNRPTTHGAPFPHVLEQWDRPIESFGKLYLQADAWHTDATGYALIARAVFDALKTVATPL